MKRNETMGYNTHLPGPRTDGSWCCKAHDPRTERNETPTEQMMNAPCVNCGERAAHHGSAGRALICQRQRYYAPTLDHPNAAETIHTLRSTVATLTEQLREARETNRGLRGTATDLLRQRDAAQKDQIEIREALGCTEDDDDYIGALRKLARSNLDLRAARDAALAEAARLRSELERAQQPSTRPIHGPFNHTPRCNTGGCHD